MLLGGGGCRVAWCCPWARMAGERSEGAEGGHFWGMWLIVHDYFYRIFLFNNSVESSIDKSESQLV